MIDQAPTKVLSSGIQSVTPEEARDKICVMSDTSSCVAERCMAWRKDYSVILNNSVENGKGYCGMVTHKG